jgi:hypothetical protein
VGGGPWHTQHGTRGNTVAANDHWVTRTWSTLFSWNELYLFHKKLQGQIEFFEKGACFQETRKVFHGPLAMRNRAEACAARDWGRFLGPGPRPDPLGRRIGTRAPGRAARE